jgi:tRNA(Arg) A34 adenosine deaminase TadA
MTADVDWAGLAPGARAALEEAYAAWRAGGLPCGAAIVDVSGRVHARGRNHVYDSATGTEILEGTALAHAELNVLARVDHDRDLSLDTMWSTQRPCSMCEAAIEFCGVGATRFLAGDPSLPTPDDVGAQTLGAFWAILANGMFLQPFLARGLADTVERTRLSEPEMVEAAELLAGELHPDLESLVTALHDRIAEMAARRVSRLEAV